MRPASFQPKEEPFYKDEGLTITEVSVIGKKNHYSLDDVIALELKFPVLALSFELIALLVAFFLVDQGTGSLKVAGFVLGGLLGPVIWLTCTKPRRVLVKTSVGSMPLGWLWDKDDRDMLASGFNRAKKAAARWEAQA